MIKKLILACIFFLAAQQGYCADYFVRDDANGSGNGLSDAAAFTKTQSDAFSFATGDRLFFKCGDSWASSILSARWANFTIGAYSGSTTILIGEDIPSELVRPTFSGVNTTILYADYTTNGYPTSFYAALVQGSTYSGTFQDLRVLNSGGIGISTSGIVSNVYRCEVRSTANAGIMAYNATSGTHSGNYVYQPARTNGAPGITNEPNDRAAGYGLTRCAGMLFQGNTIEESYGEGFQTNIWGHDLTFESNTLKNVARPSFNIYAKTNSTYNITIRKNLAFTETDAASYFKPWGGWSAPFVYLNDTNGYAAHDISIYNNLIANKSTALTFGSYPGITGSTYNVFFYNNVVAHCREGIKRESSYALLSGTNEIANNIFIETDICINVDTAVASLDWYNNAFGTTPKSECNGAGTVTGGILLSKATWTNIDNLISNDFLTSAGSTTIDAGAVLSMFSTDYFNVARPQGNGWDIGTEYTGGAVIVDPATGLIVPRNLTEIIIRTSGVTGTITLSDASWDRDIGTDCAETDAMIAALGANQTDPAWLLIKNNLDYTDFTRTTDKILTFVIDPESGFDVSVSIEIETDIPGICTSAGTPITCNPFIISAIQAATASRGMLGSSTARDLKGSFTGKTLYHKNQ